MKTSPILPVAIVLGVLAIGGTAFVLTRSAAPAASGAGTAVAAAAPTPTPQPQMRYIANRDIPPRTAITADMIRRTAITGALPPDAITSLDQVRGLITNTSIRSGEPITRAALTPRIKRVKLANFEVPTGFRAVAVYVDGGQTAAGLVDVGDRVDVIATKKLALVADKDDERVLGAKETVAGRTIATNLLVLGVDASLNETPPVPHANARAGRRARGRSRRARSERPVARRCRRAARERQRARRNALR